MTDSPLRRLLAALGRSDEPIRFGVSTPSGFSTSLIPAALVDDAVQRAVDNPVNLYFEVNPSSHGATPGRTVAGEVTRLAAIWADIDYKPKPAGMGSLLEGRDLIDDLVGILGVWPSAIVHSGHGLQPYWPIEGGEITDDNRDEVASLLRRWGALVQHAASTHGGKIDSVYDLPRILRVPGSINVKDPKKPIATSIEYPPQPQPTITLQELRDVLDENGITHEEREVSTGTVAPMTSWEWAEHDCGFAETARIEISESLPSARHAWALKYASILYGMVRGGCLTEAGFYELRTVFVDRLHWLTQNTLEPREATGQEVTAIFRWAQNKAEGWSDAKLGEELRQHIHTESLFEAATPERQQLPPSLARPSAEPSNVISIFGGRPVTETGPVTDGALALAVEVKVQQRLGLAAFTDTGNAERLAQQLRGRYIFVPSIGWHLWDGARYVPDYSGAVIEQAKDLFMHMLATANGAADVAKWAQQSLSKGRLNAAIDLCKTIPYLVKTALELDHNAFEMATPDGIIDLRTSTLRPSNPLEDFHTLRTAYAPDFEMPTPKFDAFLLWAMNGNTSMTAYLQRLFGAACIGKLMWHVFPIFLGPGANGKTTILDILAGVFGQYAAAMPAEFLVEKRGASHPTEIAQLRGVRLALISEVPPNSRFNESLLKQLTGETRLRGRYMHKDFFDFENTSSFFLAANHLPSVTVGGGGFWRRVRKVDFPNLMPDELQNPGLVQEILREEGPGVLAWAVRGAQAALSGGLQDPETVKTATRDYQLDEDAYARFVSEYLEPSEGDLTVREVAFEVYRQWMFRQGLTSETFPKFTRAILQAIPRANAGTRTVFTNTRLKAQYVFGGDE